MKHIRCVRGTTLRGWLLFAAAAMLTDVAQGQTTPSNQNNPGGAATSSGQTPSSSPQAAQPTNQAGQPNQQAGSQTAGPTGQQAMANQNDATGVKFEAAAQGQQGLRVQSVEPNSPAAQAGLQANDHVLSADGRPFRKARHLEAYLSAQAGRPVPLVIARDGRQSTVEIVPLPTQGDHGWLGVLLQEPAQNNNAPNEQNPEKGHAEANAPNAAAHKGGGAEVAQVAPQGPAARAGLRPGDIIVQVNGKEIDDAAELVADIHEMKPQAKAEFTVLRDNQEQKIPVTLGNRGEEFAQGQGQPGQEPGPGQFGGPFPGQMPPRQFPGGPNGPFAGPGFGNPNAPQMHQQIMEQNQRIEQELKQLREEVKQLREQLQKK